ncbi:6-carboxy-5,6,7,8-tetrahydropterin synthase [Phycisphaerae bacterium RAS1]|nr:6-carboxy-5,6,7,8-tetrahydropterin synthase [Phycisphaerae bacterium RAS1]
MPSYEVSVSGWFSAAHQLRLIDGSYEPLHGHNWRVTVTYAGEQLDEMGVLIDFTIVKPRLEELLRRFHDRNLNDQPAFRDGSPSAEMVARYFADQLCELDTATARLRTVEVEEAPGCLARFVIS